METTAESPPETSDHQPVTLTKPTSAPPLLPMETTTDSPPETSDHQPPNATSSSSSPPNPLSPPPETPVFHPQTDVAAQPELQPKKRRRRKKHFPEMIPSFAAINRILRAGDKSADGAAAVEIDDDAPSKNRRRRRRASNLDNEVDTEALIAISVGFPVDSLTEEEINANVVSQIGGTEQSNYIVVRNHILARWRSNVSVWMTENHALESIRAEHRGLVNTAYLFLLHHGYVNFGLAPAITKEKLSSPEGPTKGNIVIIGAGIAGLVAARQLIFLGFKVVVLEGRNRPGGRVKTKKMTGGDRAALAAAADLGGSVLTGINGNPLGVLARQLGFPLHKIGGRP